MTDAEEMIDLMRYASQVKVAAALGVTKTTTGQWAKGRDVTPYRVRQVRDLLRPPTAQETAPPGWAERLLVGVMALETKQAVSDAELDRAEALAAAWLATAEQRGRPRQGGGGAGGVSNA